jgi:signal transduction histidine kinase
MKNKVPTMKASLLTFVVIVLIASSAVAIAWTSKNMEGQISRRVAASLETVLSTTQQSLRVWQQETTMNASIVANSPEIRVAIQRQDELRHQYSDLTRSASLHDLRQRLRPYVDQHSYIDFEIISRDGVQIASGQTEFLGQSTIADLNRRFVDTIFAGIPKVGEPLRLPAERRTAQSSTNMAVGVPVLNDLNEVIAALIFRLDAAKEFTPLTSIGRLGRTGDIYMFDSQARLLTPTRFQSHPGAELKDPGGDTTEGFRPSRPRQQQPLTQMASSAVQGGSGIDLAGYRDYRGVPVVGTWVWDPDLGLGLAAEMEVSEAYAPIRPIRMLSLVMIVVVTTAVILLMRVMAHRARLQATNFGYQQALKARQDLLAIVAHDLKNPINSVALSSSVLVKMLEAPSPDIRFVVQNLGIIHRSAFRMNRLIEDLLVSTRIETGQLRIQPQECDVPPLLQELEQLVSPLAAEKSVEFICSIGPEVPRAFVDPDRLTQVLSNLVGNAIKFTPAHGVVSVSVHVQQDEIQFCVRDSGPGIASSELPRIFDQYWQAQQNKGGSGLGLYISKGLIEAHGGRIWVESVVGEGTSAYFTVPKAGRLHEGSRENTLHDPGRNFSS